MLRHRLSGPPEDDQGCLGVNGVILHTKAGPCTPTEKSSVQVLGLATLHQAVIPWGERGRTLVLWHSNGDSVGCKRCTKNTSTSLQVFSPKEEESLGSVSLEDFASVQDLEAGTSHFWTQSARRLIGEDSI